MSQVSSYRQRLRRIARAAWMRFLALSGLLRWAEWRLARRGAVVVLTFHRVLSDAEYASTDSPQGMLLKRNTFNDLVAWVRRRFVPVSLAEANPHPRRAGNRVSVALTFDDGWQDNFVHAAPIAARHAVPLTIFICPALVGMELPFWPERVMAMWRAATQRGMSTRLSELCAEARKHIAGAPAPQGQETAETSIELLKMLPSKHRTQIMVRMQELMGAAALSSGSPGIDATMTWNNVLELAQGAVSFGSHTYSHELLPRIPLEKAKQEISDSKRMVEAKVGKPCTLFAYPNGDSSLELRALVADAGYKLAFINRPGAWLEDTDPLLIPRVNLWEGSVVGRSQRFSSLAFRYVVLWKAYRALN